MIYNILGGVLAILMICTLLLPWWLAKWHTNRCKEKYFSQFEVGNIYQYWFLSNTNPFYKEGGSKYYKVLDKKDGYIKFLRLKCPSDEIGMHVEYESVDSLYYDRNHWEV